MQRWLNQALHEFKKPVIYNLTVNFYATRERLNWNNDIATFEKGIKGNVY